MLTEIPKNRQTFRHEDGTFQENVRLIIEKTPAFAQTKEAETSVGSRNVGPFVVTMNTGHPKRTGEQTRYQLPERKIRHRSQKGMDPERPRPLRIVAAVPWTNAGVRSVSPPADRSGSALQSTR